MMNKISDHIQLCLLTLKMSNALNNSRTAVYGYDQRVELLGSNGMLQSGNIIWIKQNL